MNRLLVMTVIGRDRPGLVESVANLVTNHAGNWLESRMSHLGGQFAGILRVEIPEGQLNAFTAAIPTLEAQGLSVLVQPDPAEPGVHPVRLTTIEIIGQDRPGIVQQISRTLTAHGVNVEELETECSSAAMTGETLFKARATLGIPASCNTSELRTELEKIAAELIVDVSLAELSPRRKE
jgi:glycine cleavage system regulatory protein